MFDFTALRIGFQLKVYNFYEPNDTNSSYGNVTLIKEDDRISEQTFGIRIIVGNPGRATNLATLQEVGQEDGFDYAIFSPANGSITLLFYPNQSEITFMISVVSDDLIEGTEGFRASVASQGAPFPDFQLPLSQSSITSPFQDTIIRILDTVDCKLWCHCNLELHMLY